MSGRYRLRSKIRRNLPWFLIDLGVAGKGKHDCGDHEFYKATDEFELCYHCDVGTRPHDRRTSGPETRR
jgi:hypothetical protein